MCPDRDGGDEHLSSCGPGQAVPMWRAIVGRTFLNYPPPGVSESARGAEKPQVSGIISGPLNS